jgi:hypothetical protein
VRVAGPLAALVPLATGGAERRLPGADIAGRRHLRRLLKARRAPLGLAHRFLGRLRVRHLARAAPSTIWAEV